MDENFVDDINDMRSENAMEELADTLAAIDKNVLRAALQLLKDKGIL